MTGRTFTNIVILTGAGISAESGLATFRDKGGVWAKYDYREVATPEGYAKNPAKVHEFYNMRRRDALGVKPNAAHLALAELEAELPRRFGRTSRFTLVTQNVDPLHEAAGSKAVVHMHGELLKSWCTSCDDRRHWTTDMSTATACPHCGATGHMRPDIVWFGEIPYAMDDISAALSDADLFVSIGTSGNVYPAAGFVREARSMGAHTVELNLEPSEGRSLFAEAHHGPATDIVPAFVRRLLAREV